MEDDNEKGTVRVQFAVAVNDALFAKLIHEETDAEPDDERAHQTSAAVRDRTQARRVPWKKEYRHLVDYGKLLRHDENPMVCASGASPVCLVHLVSLVGLVYLVCLVHLVRLVHRVGLVQPNKQDKPNKPIK